jgi:hypothetical protein
MTYTKAPWHICEVTGRGLKLIRDENGYCVAEAVKPANSGAAYIDADANAALIAAAPDMLEALKGLACEADADMPEAYRSESFIEALDRAFIAIAKARGEVA